jgi:uncharacterized membrane protein YccC
MVAAWRRLSRHRPKLVQALRMTASALATFALASALGLPQGFWAVITALIVTQGSVGGSLKAAWERFLGSVFGAVYGGAVAFAIPHGGGLGRAAALAVAVAPLSVLAASSAGFRVAPITAIIVLLGTTGAALGPLGFAVDRIVEIGLGCAVGILVSLLVVPARASHAVLDTADQVARLLADQLEALARPLGEQAQADLGALGMRTRQALNRLETLVGEAARERRSHLAADAPDPEPLFRTLLRLRHDLVMLRRAVREPGGGEVSREPLAQPWARAAQAGAAALRDVGQALRGRRVPAASGALAQAVGAYRTAVDEMRRRNLTRSLSTDAVGRMFGVGFALEQLRRDLDDLIERTRERSAQGEGSAEG